MSEQSPSITLTGILTLEENEGGFASSTIWINREPLDVIIANTFGGRVYRNSGADVKGAFRITIEKIDADTLANWTNTNG